MKSNLSMDFVVDKENKKIKAKREFAAPLSKVWAAWTERDILDQWWAPKPWKTETLSMDFKAGGMWLYAMVGPNGEKHYCRGDIKAVVTHKSFSIDMNFCDENGKIDTSFPVQRWSNTFSEAGNATLVSMEISYDDVAGMEKVIELGFKEGFTAALENLDEVFSAG